MTEDQKELSRLRAIIRQSIWDLCLDRPDMALVCLRYAGVEEAPLPERFAADQNINQGEKHG